MQECTITSLFPGMNKTTYYLNDHINRLTTIAALTKVTSSMEDQSDETYL